MFRSVGPQQPARGNIPVNRLKLHLYDARGHILTPLLTRYS
jgi:hypothetical protein